MVKNLPANAGDIRDTGAIPGLGRSPRVGNGNPLQYPCLGNPMAGGTWWATVQGSQRVAELLTRHTAQGLRESSFQSGNVVDRALFASINVHHAQFPFQKWES